MSNQVVGGSSFNYFKFMIMMFKLLVSLGFRQHNLLIKQINFNRFQISYLMSQRQNIESSEGIIRRAFNLAKSYFRPESFIFYYYLAGGVCVYQHSAFVYIKSDSNKSNLNLSFI